MQRILLNCNSINEAHFLKNYIETELPFQVCVALNVDEVDSQLQGKTMHLVIQQTGNTVQQDLSHALKLRSKGYPYPILVITDSIGSANIEQFHEEHKIYFLERPFELKTLKGVARKLMATKAVNQQIYRRYRTNVTATIETFISGDKFETHMFNLSRGGAYFELPKKPAVAIGDLLRLKVDLSDMERAHNIHGRVVWTTHKGHAAGGHGVGIKFMKTSDIYRKLLDKV